MSTTRQDARDSGAGQGARAIGAAAALLLAAAALGAAQIARSDDTDNPTGDDIVAGKVSVIGDAKVRRWAARSFALEVPLTWAPLPYSEKQVYGWALLKPGESIDDDADASRAADLTWATAQSMALTRVRVEVKPADTDVSASSRAYARAAKSPDTYIDLGRVNFPPTKKHPTGLPVWRLDLATPDATKGGRYISSESDYYFATCKDGQPTEAWHIIVNRSQLKGADATRQAGLIKGILGSFSPQDDASAIRDKHHKDCADVS